MVRVVNLSRTGVFVVMRGGSVATVAGRSFWASAEEAMNCLKQEKLEADERVLRTVH